MANEVTYLLCNAIAPEELCVLKGVVLLQETQCGLLLLPGLPNDLAQGPGEALLLRPSVWSHQSAKRSERPSQGECLSLSYSLKRLCNERLFKSLINVPQCPTMCAVNED